jgi:hypothetical protein
MTNKVKQSYRNINHKQRHEKAQLLSLLGNEHILITLIPYKYIKSRSFNSIPSFLRKENQYMSRQNGTINIKLFNCDSRSLSNPRNRSELNDIDETLDDAVEYFFYYLTIPGHHTKNALEENIRPIICM